jgi:DNA-binding HxlR family transcriptional regulator
MDASRHDEIGHRPEDCKPINEILSRVGDRWTSLILVSLGNERMRFKDLHQAVNGISERMLTVTLRHLERDGLIVRTAYPSAPPRVEYELSDRGRSLGQVLEPVAAWVRANRTGIEQSRHRFDMNAGVSTGPTLIEQ